MSTSDASPPGLHARFAGWIVRRRGVAFLMGLALVAAALSGLPKLKANFTHTAFYHQGDANLAEFERFERQFGNDDSVIVVVHSPSGVFDQSTIQLVREMTRELWLTPDVIRVDSISNFSWVHAFEDDIVIEPLIPDEGVTDAVLAERREIALAHEILPGYLVSHDSRTTLVYARVRPGFESPPDAARIVESVRGTIERLRDGDHEIHVTGAPFISNAFRQSSMGDTRRLMPLVIAAVIILLVLMFRTVTGVLLPLFVVALAAGSAIALAGHFRIEFTTVTAILPFVMIAVGIADSVHILSGFVRRRRAGEDKLDAVRGSLERNLLPTILTSCTTAAGFFAFATSDLKPVFGVGLLAGAGTLLTWFITYLLLGPLLCWLPSRVRPAKRREATAPGAGALRYARAVAKRRRWIIAGFAAVSVCAVVLSARTTVNASPYKYFAEDYPLRRAHDFIVSNFGGVTNFEIRVSAGEPEGIKDPEFLHAVEAFEERIHEVDGVKRSISIVDTLRQTNRALFGGGDEHYRLPDTREAIAQELLLYTMSLPQGHDVNHMVTVQEDALRISAITNITDSADWTAAAARFEEIGRELGIQARVTGKAKLFQSMNGYVVSSFIHSIAIAIVVISLILMVSYRSIRVGLIALPANLVPLLVGGAVLRLLDRPLDIGTVLVASVCLGIAVDDTIHFITSYLRNRAEMRPEASVASSLSQTGPALLITTVVLVVGFGILVFGTFLPNVYFGLMTAVILSFALAADLTFLPALLLACERKSGQTS